MQKEVILWDNDGVLVDTEKYYFRAVQEVLAGESIAFSPEMYLAFFLQSSTGLMFLKEAAGYSEVKIEQLRTRRNEIYLSYLITEPLLMPGVVEILTELKGHYRMAIVTSSDSGPFERVHQRTGLLPFFEFYLCSANYTHSKPHPEPYLLAIERMGYAAKPHLCLAIEDTRRGLVAATRAGIDCIVVPTDLTLHDDFSEALNVVNSLEELRVLLTNQD